MLVSLYDECKDVIGTQLLEALDDVGKFAGVDFDEDAADLLEGLEAKADRDVQFFFLTHI